MLRRSFAGETGDQFDSQARVAYNNNVMVLKREQIMKEQRRKYLQQKEASLQYKENKLLKTKSETRIIAVNTYVNPVTSRQSNVPSEVIKDLTVKEDPVIEKSGPNPPEKEVVDFANLPKTPFIDPIGEKEEIEEVKDESEPNPKEEIEIPRTVSKKDYITEFIDPATPIARRKQLLMSPYPSEYGTLQCTIQRVNTGLSKKMYPEYKLMLSGNYKYILMAKQTAFVGGSHYVITYDAVNFERKNPNCLGKLRSFAGQSSYNLFDQGENPKTCSLPELIRAQHFSILIRDDDDTKKMHVMLPKLDKDNEQITWKPVHDKEHMIEQFKQGKTKNMICLINKSPELNHCKARSKG
eukprot:TRINITY_DN1615_c0_g2_i1.p1 TRINITY_DN1615_c0_g2~~TRINITY_DN1615_c0_g2_i1.p1  ORF type:complete len:353 (-),score=79.01 TRINITY_DN1615_c0_g2_i1:300-1358(-)